jgi:hypothetical protein
MVASRALTQRPHQGDGNYEKDREDMSAGSLPLALTVPGVSALSQVLLASVTATAWEVPA